MKNWAERDWAVQEQAVRDWVTLARPRQWTKNLLLYAAVLFTLGEVWGPGDYGYGAQLFERATVAFVAFSLLSSAGYLLNDARDAATDRLHPRKQRRPIAAGRIAPRSASVAAAILAGTGLIVASIVSAELVIPAATYVVGTTAYSLALKRIPIIDVVIVAGLFVVRVWAGAVAIDEPASPWILVCTFAGALYVASVKRQQDRWLLGEEAFLSHRPATLRQAPTQALRQTLRRWPSVVAICAGMATAGLYGWYAAFVENVPPGGRMLMSWPFVPIAIIRYWHVARARPDSDADEIAFRDPWVLLAVVLFLVAAILGRVS